MRVFVIPESAYRGENSEVDPAVEAAEDFILENYSKFTCLNEDDHGASHQSYALTDRDFEIPDVLTRFESGKCTIENGKVIYVKQR